MNTKRRTSQTCVRVWGSCGVALFLAMLATSACGGVSDVKTNHSDGTAGDADTAGTAGTGATAGTSSGGANTDGVCQPGERRCDGDTPQACKTDAWIPEAPCDSKTQACTGAGVCAAFRLLDAGIGTLGERPAEPVAGAKLILKSQTLSAVPRVCTAKLCITGDVR